MRRSAYPPVRTISGQPTRNPVVKSRDQLTKFTTRSSRNLSLRNKSNTSHVKMNVGATAIRALTKSAGSNASRRRHSLPARTCPKRQKLGASQSTRERWRWPKTSILRCRTPDNMVRAYKGGRTNKPRASSHAERREDLPPFRDHTVAGKHHGAVGPSECQSPTPYSDESGDANTVDLRGHADQDENVEYSLQRDPNAFRAAWQRSQQTEMQWAVRRATQHTCPCSSCAAD